VLKLDRCNVVDRRLSHINKSAGLRQPRAALHRDSLLGSLCLRSLHGVCLHSVEKVLSASGLLNMLNAHVDSLFDDAIADLLVYFHSNCSRGDIPNDTGSAMIVFVREAFVNGAVAFDVHKITDLVRGQVLGQMDRALSSERLGKQTSGASTISE